MVFSVPQPSSGSWEGRAFKAERMPAGSARVGKFDSCSDRWEMTEVTRGRSRENSSDEEVLVKLIEAGRGGKEGDGGGLQRDESSAKELKGGRRKERARFSGPFAAVSLF